MGKVELTEAALRDHLAEHLELIEPDLALVRKEYPLPNSAGTRGRVDILARDSLGCFVIIELKRSNASARSAIHELMKYLGLFRREKRLPATRLRCVLVSTDWDELLVPFSEQVNNSPFTLQGRKLLLAPDGTPRQTDLVPPLSDYNELIWPQEFSWLTFTTESQRETISSTLMRMLPAVGVENQVLVKTTSRRPEALQFPFGLLLPFFPLGRSETVPTRPPPS